MAQPPIPRSQRFTKAARAERDRLARKRSQLSKRREGLQAKVNVLDEELAAVEEEIRFLEALEGPQGDQPIEIDRSSGDSAKLLSGAMIRMVAVPLLLEEHGTAPIHYRAWLELLELKGFAVAGKRPDAVFLNQVSRSPLVCSTTKAGFYVIDPAIVDRLRAKLRRQQSDLAACLSEIHPDPAGFEKQRRQQRDLGTAIARTERELDEALKVMGDWQASGLPEAKAA